MSLRPQVRHGKWPPPYCSSSIHRARRIHDDLLSPILFSALVGVCEVLHGQPREFDSAVPCAPALPPPTRGGLAPSHHLRTAAAVTHLPQSHRAAPPATPPQPHVRSSAGVRHPSSFTSSCSDGSPLPSPVFDSR
uniref:Uncharacterized protein n=1 Tax=Triticum urartu TaxID=4572 RepID=A0A8R7QDV3_TRIUA